MRHLGINGMVLKKQNYGEYDQFITIFSPTLGKIEAVAKGARKIDSPFTGHLELLNICTFELYKKTQNFTIIQCQNQKTFKALRNDFNRTILALLLLEIFQKSTPEEGNGEALFELLETTLNQLEKSQKSFIVIETFKIKLMQLLGILPDISRCSHCSKKWEKISHICIDEDGNLYCKNCQREGGSKESISFNIMKLIHFLTKAEFQGIEKIRLLGEEKKLLQKITNVFLQKYINREIFSEKILTQIS